MAKQSILSQAMKDWRLTLLGTLLICIPAFRNGFPFVYADTHAYLHAGMTLSVPFDRPIFYGIWLALSSLTLSLWIPVLMQAGLTSLLLLRLCKHFLPINEVPKYFLAGTSILTLFSGMALNATMLLPDAFTPILVLSAVLYLYDAAHRRQYFALLLLSSVMHNSHWLILGVLSAFLLLRYFFDNRFGLRPILNLLGITVLAAFLLSTTNYLKFKKFTPSTATSFFMMGRLAETGLLAAYLEKRCAEEPDYFLCDLREQLPMGASEFIWGEWGPTLYKGGLPVHEKAYHALIGDVFSNPIYVVKFAYRSLGDGIHQLFLNRILLDSHGTASYTQKQLEKYFPTDATAARQSMQVYEHGLMTYMNLGYQLLLLLSFCVIGYAWYRNQVSFAVVLLLLGILSNAFITSTFANVDSRLQSRAAWLLIVAAFWTWQQFKVKPVNQAVVHD